MRTIVIYGGRFHPPHGGHRQVYESFAKKYGAENVFIATSGKQDSVDKPFSFEEKKKMWIASGVPAQQVVQVVSPYNPREIYKNLDLTQTIVLYPIGANDQKRFTYQPKKDGSPSYMQPAGKDMQPANKHGYITSLPRFDFSVLGKNITSGTSFRNMYLSVTDQQKLKILTELYGPQGKQFKPLFDKRLGSLTTESLVREFADFITEIKSYKKTYNHW